MKILAPLAAVAVLFLLGLLGAAGTVPGAFFGIVIPYLAAAVLLGGLVYRVLKWARTPVPFRIPTTCGQQRSLDWIEPARLDNPSGTLGVLGRMALEVGLFRSLLRNTKSSLLEGGRLACLTSLGLWLGALAFHGALLVILLRHLRLLTDPVPAAVTLLARADGLLEIGMPVVYVSTCLFLAAVVYLLGRRLCDSYLRYLSLPEDFFLLFLILGIALSGLWMRHVSGSDVAAIKQLVMGLVTFRPTIPTTIGPLPFGHLFLVCVLAAYIPFGKLMHLAGALLSPTRNLANNSRRARHVNPWDYPVKVHTYEEYEDELRDKMKSAGIPVEKESDP